MVCSGRRPGPLNPDPSNAAEVSRQKVTLTGNGDRSSSYVVTNGLPHDHGMKFDIVAPLAALEPSLVTVPRHSALRTAHRTAPHLVRVPHPKPGRPSAVRLAIPLSTLLRFFSLSFVVAVPRVLAFCGRVDTRTALQRVLALHPALQRGQASRGSGRHMMAHDRTRVGPSPHSISGASAVLTLPVLP